MFLGFSKAKNWIIIIIIIINLMWYSKPTSFLSVFPVWPYSQCFLSYMRKVKFYGKRWKCGTRWKFEHTQRILGDLDLFFFFLLNIAFYNSTPPIPNWNWFSPQLGFPKWLDTKKGEQLQCSSTFSITWWCKHIWPEHKYYVK